MVVLVATWGNSSSIEGIGFKVKPSDLGLWRLDYLCATFAFLSAGAHLFVVSFSRYGFNDWHRRVNLGWYYESIERCLIAWRWVEYSISAPVMLVALLFVTGLHEMSILLLAFFLQSGCMWCGFLVEFYSTPGPKRDWNGVSYWRRIVPYWLGLYLYIPGWVVFLWTFYQNVREAREVHDRGPPQWVQLILWGEISIFSTFAVPILVFQAQHPKYYWWTEAIYSVLSLVAKVILNGVLLSNVIVVGRLE